VSALPDRLGRYAVRRRIGAGGFATVWLAYDEHLDSPVAVKVLADNWTEDHHVRTRFVEEGRYLRRVESPHVVTVYDAGELDDGRPYLVMTYADQGTLADRLETRGLEVAEATEVIRQVAAGLQALHDRDILHRDVKPANVLFRSVGNGAAEPGVRAMLGDLGLGKALDVSSRLTMIAGSPSFVAPEQAQGETPGRSSDQYSLAVITHLLLGGRMPWRHADLTAAARPSPPPPLASVDRPFPDEVDDVVRRALSPAPADRWPSVTAYVDALTTALGDWAVPAGQGLQPWQAVDPELTQPGARPSPMPVSGQLGDPVLPNRSRRLVAMTAVTMLALGVGAVAGWFGFRALDRDVTITDSRDELTVTVPDDWDASVAGDPWTPPGEKRTYAALSVGTSAGWAHLQDGEGVFAGIMPGDDIPDQLPGHPVCETAEDPIDDTIDGDMARTIVYTGCRGAGVTVERVVQVATNRLLWVQVRSADRATANDVLESVATTGL
jgi:eukaryotic-like serine/threonine-protein kinase